MDLAVLGVPTDPVRTFAVPSLAIHRTVHWPKIATLPASALEDPTPPGDVAVTVTPGLGGTKTNVWWTRTCWRPDGRVLAVAAEHLPTLPNLPDATSEYPVRIHVFGMEALLTTPVTTTANSGNNNSSSSGGGAGANHTPGDLIPTWTLDLTVPQPTTTSQPHSSTPTVHAMTWAHVVGRHPVASFEHGHESHYRAYVQAWNGPLSRPVPYPTSNYHTPLDRHSSSSLADVHPTRDTPLSLLVVTTTHGTLQAFLHGRYPVLRNLRVVAESTTNPHTTGPVRVSADLAHIMVLPKTSPSTRQWQIWSLPALARHRPTWQALSTLYTHVQQHLQAIVVNLAPVVSTYQSSLKPLDVKLQGLVALLEKYSVDTHVTDRALQQHLVQYVLAGHGRDADLSNAMDQFFTSMPMNDQLLLRMEHTLTVAVANVEATVRETLLAPAQALCHEASTVLGLARSWGDGSYLSPSAATQLAETAQILLIAVETTVQAVVDARFRLRDYVAWLRSTGAQIRARGTAPGSVQRDNAQKRRVSDAVAARMLAYLQSATAPVDDSAKVASGTEHLLGIAVSDLWRDDRNAVAWRPASPSSVTDDGIRSMPTIPYALRHARQAAARLFAQPQVNLQNSVRCQQITLEECGAVALHTRIGRGSTAGEHDWNHGDEINHGFFRPVSVDQNQDQVNTPKQWSLVAQVDSSNPGTVHVYALPLAWTDPTLDDFVDDEQDEDGSGPMDTGKPYWRCALVLPQGSVVQQVAFYGDDGNSSLSSSNTDEEPRHESRQALGLLVERPHGQLDLWLVLYDEAPFQCARLDGRPLVSAKGNGRLVVQPQPTVGSEDESLFSEAGVLLAKTRVLKGPHDDTAPTDQTSTGLPPRLVVSGSRGVVAVTSATQHGGSILELLDVEEDEEDNDPDDSMEPE